MHGKNTGKCVARRQVAFQLIPWELYPARIRRIFDFDIDYFDDCQFGRDNCTIEAGKDYSFIRTNRAKPKYMIRKVPGLVEKQAEVKYGNQ